MSHKAPNGACLFWLRDHAFCWERDECLIYPFSPGSHGYGTLTIDGHQILAHRYICTIFHSDAPSLFHQTAHLCGIKLCVNKHHLRWATRSENESDKITHGTHNRGEHHGGAKLTMENVKNIRIAAGYHKDIAKRYDISRQTVGDIKNRRRWQWI